MKKTACLIAAAVLWAGTAAWCLPGFPSYVSLPGVDIPEAGSLTVENVGEAEFYVKEGQTVTKQGKHYRSYLTFTSGKNPGAAVTWKQWLPALTQAGFKVIGSDGSSTYTLQRTAGGIESWLRVSLEDYNDPLLELIEIKAMTASLNLPKPAAQPEKFGDKDDFPYLSHYPGTVLVQTSQRNEPLDVTISNVDSEPALAGTGYRVKSYTAPSTLSRLEFDKVYRDALIKAGWTVKPASPGSRPGEQAIVASYIKDGRNLWATLARADPSSDLGVSIAVADIGAEDWAAALDKSCRLPLYGIHFDFNRATLRPDSEPVLQQVLALLKSKTALAVEIQGHTDNVGGDDANLKLSEARAQAVTQWLVSHGIAAGRLTAKGYGKKVPVAPNDSDKSRALNRRVELRKQGCSR
jgi:outer membrane protein OmpA-like peptidoglycan-associated protein